MGGTVKGWLDDEPVEPVVEPAVLPDGLIGGTVNGRPEELELELVFPNVGLIGMLPDEDPETAAPP